MLFSYIENPNNISNTHIYYAGTGKAQPCDIGYQRPIKHIIKTQCIKNLIQQTERQLDNSVLPENVRVDFSVAALRNRTPTWLLAAWEWSKAHPEIILSAWSRAEFKQWNLSYSFLTSPYAQHTANERFDDDHVFALSIGNILTSVTHQDLEINTDGCSYDDDPTLSAVAISELQSGSNKDALEAHHAALESGDFVYVGDDDLTDNDAEGESDPEFAEETDEVNIIDAHVYRHTSAMSSPSSLVDGFEDGLSEDTLSETEYQSVSRSEGVVSEDGVPEDLIGPNFVIVD